MHTSMQQQKIEHGYARGGTDSMVHILGRRLRVVGASDMVALARSAAAVANVDIGGSACGRGMGLSTAELDVVIDAVAGAKGASADIRS